MFGFVYREIYIRMREWNLKEKGNCVCFSVDGVLHTGNTKNMCM